MTETRLYTEVRYDFKDDEIREMGEALARENQNLLDLRDEKSSAVAAFAAKIKETGIRAIELATRINNRYEMREVEVFAIMDTPRPGMKALVPIDRPDPEFAVRYEPMTATEKQETFGFDLGGDQ